MNKHDIPTWKVLTAASNAAIIQVTSTAPADRLSLRMQTTSANRGIVATFQSMIKAEGFRGLWMGNGTNAIKNVPQGCIMFGTYQTLKSFYKDPENPTWSERVFAGVAAGFNQLFFVYPLELIKTRMALCPKGTYRSITHCASEVRLHEGWRSLFNGLCPSIYANVGYLGGQLIMFDIIKDLHKSHFDGAPIHPAALYSYGLLSQMPPIASVYPFFVVKNRMQLQGYAGTEVLYSNMRNCMKTILQTEGVRGFYKGIVPYCIKIIPGGAINLAVYDWTKDSLMQYC